MFIDYLKSLSQEARDLMDEIEDANDDIDGGIFSFTGSNKERFKFNTFNKPSQLSQLFIMVTFH